MKNCLNAQRIKMTFALAVFLILTIFIFNLIDAVESREPVDREDRFETASDVTVKTEKAWPMSVA
jgi:hypothetical protein